MCIPMRPSVGPSQARSAWGEAIDGTLPGLPVPWHSGQDASSPQQAEQVQPEAVQELAKRAQQQDLSIIDRAIHGGAQEA